MHVLDDTRVSSDLFFFFLSATILYPNLGRSGSLRRLVGIQTQLDQKECSNITLRFFKLQMRFEPSPTVQGGT